MTSGTTAPARAEPSRAREPGLAAEPGPTWRDTVASEWAKLISLRSNVVTMTVSVLVGLALSALLAVLVGATWPHWDQAGRDDFDPVMFPLTAGILPGVLMIGLSVRTVTGEYGSGMMRLTLTATPRRDRLLTAKAVVVTGANLLVGTVVTIGGVLLAQMFFAAYDVPTARLGDPDTVRALLAGSALSPLFALIGLAIAVLVRGAAASTIAVLGLVFAPAVVGSVLPDWWQRNIVAWMPGPASDALTIAPLDVETDYLAVGPALVAVALWVALPLAAALLALNRRDA
jgi:ABC-2 type transport system permease protein